MNKFELLEEKLYNKVLFYINGEKAEVLCGVEGSESGSVCFVDGLSASNQRLRRSTI